MKISIPSIDRLLGVTDDELDSLVRSVKMRLPHIGYRMRMGELQAMGYHVKWEQVSVSMHRVDAAGILERMASVGCVARRVYSVKGPLSLAHVDTNHKLIRFVYSTCLYVQYSGYTVTIFISEAFYINSWRIQVNFYFYKVKKKSCLVSKETNKLINYDLWTNVILGRVFHILLFFFLDMA